MEHYTKLQIDLKAPTQSLVDAIEKNADAISDMVASGVNRAINGFDFEKEVQNAITNFIQETLKRELTYSRLEWLIRQKIKITIKKELEAYIDKIKIELK